MNDPHLLMPALLKPRDVAHLTSRTEQALSTDRMNRVGIPFVKINARVVRYRAADVVAYIEAHTVRPLPTP